MSYKLKYKGSRKRKNTETIRQLQRIRFSNKQSAMKMKSSLNLGKGWKTKEV